MNSLSLQELERVLPSAEAISQEMARRRTSLALAQDAESVKGRCKSLASFIREAWHVLLPDTPYVHNWHLDLICRHLEAVTRGEFLARGLQNRLLLNVPPGTMKSLVMVFWTAWEWGPEGLPGIQATATSFKEDNCTRDQNRFRKLVKSDWFQKLWPVDIVKDSEEWIENSRGGWRKTSAYQSLTGGRSDRLIIDDPHSVDTAESDADREKAERTFRESATSRLNDPGKSAIIVIMQRLHEKDISGVILSAKMPYVHVMLPMRFEPERRSISPFGEDPRTYEGELLFTERFPESVVDRDEAAMGSHATAGQHQQRPAPRGGLRFKRHWFTIVKVSTAQRRVRAWDLAASEKKTSAYTAAVRLGHDPKRRKFIVEHVMRTRVPNPEPVIVNIASQDGKGVEIDLPQDPGQAGKIQAKALVGALAGYIVKASPESGDKLARAEPVIAQAEAMNIEIVEGDWNEAFLDELEKFPSGAYKDQVDALSRAFGRFIMSKGAIVAMPIITTAPSGNYGDNNG